MDEARRQVDAEILVDKEQTILELRETVEILEVGGWVHSLALPALHGTLLQSGSTKLCAGCLFSC